MKEYSTFWNDLENIAAGGSNRKIRISPSSSYAVYSKLGSNEGERQARAKIAASQVEISKATKNPTEIEGMRNAHVG